MLTKSLNAFPSRSRSLTPPPSGPSAKVNDKGLCKPGLPRFIQSFPRTPQNQPYSCVVLHQDLVQGQAHWLPKKNLRSMKVLHDLTHGVSKRMVSILTYQQKIESFDGLLFLH